MTIRLLLSLALLAIAAPLGAAQHVTIPPDQVKWGPAPPALPPGAQLAVLSGDPSQAGSFSLRLKFPDGYVIPPHWHPTDENVVVIQGVFRLGMGEKLNLAAATDMPAGAYIKLPKEMRHFATTKGETIVHVYGTGPFVLNFVNASDNAAIKK